MNAYIALCFCSSGGYKSQVMVESSHIVACINWKGHTGSYSPGPSKTQSSLAMLASSHDFKLYIDDSPWQEWPNLISKINSLPHWCTEVAKTCPDSYDSIWATDTFSQTVVNRGSERGKEWREKQRHFTAMTTQSVNDLLPFWVNRCLVWCVFFSMAWCDLCT